MNSFLKHTAQEILKNQYALKDLVIVLPNRRAGLFFTQHLGRLIDQPTWMPEIRTIEDVFYGLAGQRPEDNLTLIFELYKVYQNIHPEAESFDRFYFWGEMILKDFNDVDQFMGDARKLYKYVSEVKELESDLGFLTPDQVALIRQFWSSFQAKDKKHQEKFLSFWQVLAPLYAQFQTALDVAGMAYSGKLYRKVIETLDAISKPKKHYIFVGFNAFTATEEKLIKHFIAEFNAEIFWDIDAYYLEDPFQEAGLFFREYQKDRIFGPTFPEILPKQINTKKPKIEIYASPLKNAQANLVGAILEQISQEENLEETVIILPDEQLLFPVLHSLPDSISKVNVTMGYPIRNAPVYAFLESVLELQRFTKVEDGSTLFYHQQVSNLLSTVFFKALDEEFIHGILDKIQQLNQVYIPEQELHAGGGFFQLVFQKVKPQELFDYLSHIIEAIAYQSEEEYLQKSYLFQSFKQLNRLKEILSQQDIQKLDLELMIRLFRQIFREVKLPFEGEPLEGLQVMGVLETRNLDFKRVIICNMNEDSFPPSATLNSMIPFNIRKAFGLPVQEQNDAIYAYTFYRLLHQADEVHMIYVSASDQGKAGEKSRYIQQMIVEMDLDVEEKTVFIPVDLMPVSPITIVKDEGVMDHLEKYVVQPTGKANTSFSPSAINVYLDCRLKFYLQYIADIKEKEQVKESVDPSVFGNIAHYSMEILYQGFMARKKRNVLEPEDFEDLKKNWVFPSIEKGIRKFYNLEDSKEALLNGQLAIVRDVLQKYIVRLLEIDQKDAPFQIISMEQEYKAAFDIENPGPDVSVSLKGYIDRVDLHQGNIRLIDYKSGGDVKHFNQVESLFDRENGSRNKAAMQTLFYGLLYQSNELENSLPLKPAIFNFKQVFSDDFNPYLIEKTPQKTAQEVLDYRDYKEDFVSQLKLLFQEMFDPSIPFDQTEDLKKCQYCTYAEICRK
jgi:CRISPR/Cas system-associated exonuclease Cas4 (RecB family)